MKARFFTLFFCLFFRGFVFSQVQLGSTLIGLAANDLFGSKVALSADGQVLAVTATMHTNQNGEMAGQVRVFRWNDSDWEPLGDPIEGSSAGERLGTSVALSADGQVLAVGASGYTDSQGNVNAGKVEVWYWNGNDWDLQGNPLEGDTLNMYFGSSVALSASGDFMAVGTPTYSANFLAQSGRVWLYSWSDGVWQQDTFLDGTDAYMHFGIDLSLSDSGEVLAVGGSSATGPDGGLSGSALVFSRQNGTWEQMGDALFGAPGSLFGGALSLSADGQLLAVGAAKYSEEAGGENGLVRVFSWDGTSWEQKGDDLIGTAHSSFGKALALSANGEVLAIGAPLFHGYYGSQSGLVRIYAWENGAWSQRGLDIEGMSSYDETGNAVALSADGGIVAVATRHDNNAAGYYAGNVRLFELCPPSMASLDVEACGSYTVPSGDTIYTESGVYVDEIPNAAGCGDSIITLNLTIYAIDVSVTQTSSALVANEVGASFQWLDCTNGYSALSGETSQVFSPTSSGSYAVEVMQNGCIDTSACYDFVVVSTTEQIEEEHVLVYPNPSRGVVQVELGAGEGVVEIWVRDEWGRLVRHEKGWETGSFSLNLDDLSGWFLIQLRQGQTGEIQFFKVFLY